MSQSSPESTASPNKAGAKSSLAGAKRCLVLSRWLGKASACFFILAALCVADALQTLVRYEFNRIDIIPGEEIAVSGLMPYEISSHADMEFSFEGVPGLDFKPMETFKGFWMGGMMWRAVLTASPDIAAMQQDDAYPWQCALTVVDIMPMRKVGTGEEAADGEEEYLGLQNPQQVYSIQVWPDAASRQAADLSFSRRLTGYPAFGLGFGVLALALLAGVGNWFMFSRAEVRLARYGIYVIHGIKAIDPKNPSGPLARKGKGPKAKTPRDKKVAFAHAGIYHFKPGSPMALLDASWQQRATGIVIEIEKFKAFAVFSAHGVAPRYGWLVSYIAEED